MNLLTTLLLLAASPLLFTLARAKDEHESCLEWAEAGECATSKYLYSANLTQPELAEVECL